MDVAVLILLIFGFVLFVLAGFRSPPDARYGLIGLGLACWILTAILTSPLIHA